MYMNVKVALIGAGLRGRVYADYALQHPEHMSVVAVAEPNKTRRERAMQTYGIQKENGFSDWRELFKRSKLADAVMICTQDNMHVQPTLAALEAGYHVLLEKPMSPDPLECLQIADKVRETGKLLSVCHVLRYTPFFMTIKQMIDEGRIGRLISIQHNENVGYLHQAHSFVRGNWRNSKASSPMILAKSCHDMDILLWLVGADCEQIASFGTLSHFRRAYAPQGAPLRCTDGCPVEDTCLYYAPKIYVKAEETNFMAMALCDDSDEEARLQALREGPYGRCVYHCDNDVVDHQVVSMSFANEVTVAFTMSAFTQETTRTIKLMGTHGEIRGHMEAGEITWIPFGGGQVEKVTQKGTDAGGHGGGDLGIVKDFIRLIREGNKGESRTSASISVQSHLMAFAAEKSRVEGKVVHLPTYLKTLREQVKRRMGDGA